MSVLCHPRMIHKISYKRFHANIVTLFDQETKNTILQCQVLFSQSYLWNFCIVTLFEDKNGIQYINVVIMYLALFPALFHTVYPTHFVFPTFPRNFLETLKQALQIFITIDGGGACCKNILILTYTLHSYIKRRSFMIF